MREKDKLKIQTKYELQIKAGHVVSEDITICQEENIEGRNAIQLSIYESRWRTPEDTVILLEGVIEAIKRYFIDDKIKELKED